MQTDMPIVRCQQTKGPSVRSLGGQVWNYVRESVVNLMNSYRRTVTKFPFAAGAKTYIAASQSPSPMQTLRCIRIEYASAVTKSEFSGLHCKTDSAAAETW